MDNFTGIYKKYYKRIYCYIYSLCNNSKLSEDIVQETFYKALMLINAGKLSEFGEAWLVRVAHNLFIDYVRKKDRWLMNEDYERSMDYIPQERLLSTMTINMTLEKLPVRYRSIILLKDYFGFSLREIASILGITENSAKVTLHRAREKFREVYENEK